MTVTIHSVSGDVLIEAEIEPWHAVPVAIAVDLVPDEQVDHRIRPINSPGQQPKLFGRAVTVRCEPPDFGAVLHALDQIKHGDVLVIAADGRDDRRDPWRSSTTLWRGWAHLRWRYSRCRNSFTMD